MNGGPPTTPGLPVAPVLLASDIRQELERLFSKERHAYLAALFGRGERCELAVQGRNFTVVPTRCELELRAAMPPPGEELRANKVFLIDWTDEQPPLDIRCRLAGRRMFRISRDARLAGLFGARTAEPGLEGTALSAVLLSGAVDNLKKVSGQVLRRAEAYRRFLHARFKYPLEDELTLARHLCFCMTSDTGKTLVDKAERDATWARLRDELRSFAAETGPLGKLGWIAWETGEGSTFVELCLLVEALLPEIGKGTFADGLLRGHVRSLAPRWGDALLAQAGLLADAAVLDAVLAELEAQDPRAAVALLERADERATDPELRKALAGSPRLPVGYQARGEALALALQRQAEAPSAERLQAAIDALHDLEAHRLRRDEPRATGERRRTAVRLAAYLFSRSSTADASAAGADYQEALDLAEAYARDGGYVDWARQQLRVVAEGALGRAVQSVLARVDEARLEDDLRFAEGLLRWVVASEPATQVVPISQALQRLVAELLGEKEHRKLLVLLMDGMSWANVVELVPSLAEERWAPACWRPKGHRQRPAGVLPPIFAALPTLTHVSRAAFFAGKMVAETSEEATGLDPKRWAQNRYVKALARDEVPELLLKDQILVQGQVTSRAKELVASEHRLVGLVVNAIDDQLAAGQQMRVPCTVGEIKPLRELLVAAEDAERAVLLIADHGHVPGDPLSSRGPREGGHRWRPLRTGEEPAEFEVKLPQKGTWRPRGSDGVAAIWDPRACYGNPRYGEHGGVSLAEVVAPAILIVPETLAEARPGELDEALATTRFPEPDWWQLDAPRHRPAAVTHESRPTKQLVIPATAPAAPAVTTTEAQATEAVPELVEGLQKSKVFKEHTRGLPAPRVAEALRQLAVLVSAGDQISEGELARRCGVQDYRVVGLVVRLGEVLNHDGYTVIEHDRNGQQVRLNRARLVQLFEVKT